MAKNTDNSKSFKTYEINVKSTKLGVFCAFELI